MMMNEERQLIDSLQPTYIYIHRHDAGDHIKFGFPLASAVTVLTWGGLEFEQG